MEMQQATAGSVAAETLQPPSPAARRLPTVLVAVVLAAVVLASRLPFLGPGLGLHSDAGALLTAAHEIHRTGEYHPSRFPGYPVHEYALSYLVALGPTAINLATALCSVAAAVFLGLTLRTLAPRGHWALGALAFAMAPAVYVSSTVIYDYVWAAALVLAGLYAALRGWDLVAGGLLGLATGCRLTSATMIAPLWLIVLARHSGGRRTLTSCLASGAIMGIVAGACYSPLLVRYGLRFIRAYPDAISTAPNQVLRWLTIDLLGPVGFGAVLLGLAVQLVIRLRSRRRSSGAAPTPTSPQADLARSGWITAAWALPALVYLGVFLAMPHRLEYLIPVVFLTILLLARHLERRLFAGVCLALILSPFLWVPTWRAPIRWNHLQRQQQAKFLQDVLQKAADSEGRTLVFSGRSDLLLLHAAQLYLWPNAGCEYHPQVVWHDGSPVVLQMDLHSRRGGGLVRIAHFRDRQSMKQAAQEGFKMAYLPTAREWYLRLGGFDLADLGARPFVGE